MASKNLKIAVICGGLSCEREVSLRSGGNIFESLKRLGYRDAFLFDFDSIVSLQKLIELKTHGKIDCAILMTHGKYGEDGCLQGFLELLQIPYSGSGVEASANCMNKITSKLILLANKLPVLPFYLTSLLNNSTDNLGSFGFKSDDPIIVKPIGEGSSVGIEKFDNFAQFMTQHEHELKTKYENYFIEPFIRGIEITASIITKEDNFFVLPLLELRPKKEFYDYEAKYTKGMTEFVLPADVPEQLAAEIKKYALRAYIALNCKGFARVDFIVAKGERFKPYILELNTLPGMTDTSDLPAQAKAAGIEYDALVDLLVSDMLAKSPQEIYS